MSMKADRFFSVHYDMRHHPKIELLKKLEGGIVALGRWFVLLSILYDVGGVIDVNKPLIRSYLADELDMDGGELDGFLSSCAECELISSELLKMGHVASEGVSEQLDYQRKKSEAGKKGMAKRWNKGDSDN